MATLVETTFEELPAEAFEIGVSWENEAECDFLIREALESDETIYVVREYHYNGDHFEQWSDAYFSV
mgnify:CR=1 FL=1